MVNKIEVWEFRLQLAKNFFRMGIFVGNANEDVASFLFLAVRPSDVEVSPTLSFPSLLPDYNALGGPRVLPSLGYNMDPFRTKEHFLSPPHQQICKLPPACNR